MRVAVKGGKRRRDSQPLRCRRTLKRARRRRRRRRRTGPGPAPTYRRWLSSRGQPPLSAKQLLIAYYSGDNRVSFCPLQPENAPPVPPARGAPGLLRPAGLAAELGAPSTRPTAAWRRRRRRRLWLLAPPFWFLPFCFIFIGLEWGRRPKLAFLQGDIRKVLTSATRLSIWLLYVLPFSFLVQILCLSFFLCKLFIWLVRTFHCHGVKMGSSRDTKLQGPLVGKLWNENCTPANELSLRGSEILQAADRLRIASVSFESTFRI